MKDKLLSTEEELLTFLELIADHPDLMMDDDLIEYAKQSIENIYSNNDKLVPTMSFFMDETRKRKTCDLKT